ncbi:MAG: rubrerythrin family protein [Candidatus Eisenbacteria bacterium]|uniref:Rubrerythrin family protein n=1 Tax=Eiseniibacteriota bacterium TaxID=2212470 RepID=A0A933SFZ7_UNCEI|nr:rubrerythrin family protein [Candidatus Eisenbacteria bacterium]
MHAMRTVAVLGMIAGLVTAGGVVHAQPLEGRTIPALRLAHANEVTARAEYAAYAEQAEAEGLLGIRDLYRALEQCEAEHAARHARMLEGYGVTVEAEPAAPVVGTTRENLERAFSSERAERRARYPKLADAVRPELAYDVLADLRWCSAAEATHARALSEALDAIGEMAAPHVWYACSECGCIRGEHSNERCACGMNGDTFLAFGGGEAPRPVAGAPMIAWLPGRAFAFVFAAREK